MNAWQLGSIVEAKTEKGTWDSHHNAIQFSIYLIHKLDPNREHSLVKASIDSRLSAILAWAWWPREGTQPQGPE